MVETPVIVVNFKVYNESIGKNALKLAKICDEVAGQTGKSIAVCLSATDISPIAKEVNIPVWGQAADAVEPGGHTGSILLEALKEVGAKGTLINHSEHRLKIADIEWLVMKARKLGLDTCVCTNNVPTSMACAAFSPDFIAVEPPELIGGDISVTKADPKVVSGSVEAVRKVNSKVKVLCGAGVKNGKDVAKAVELGAVGVLLASGVTKVSDPRKALVDMVTGLSDGWV